METVVLVRRAERRKKDNPIQTAVASFRCGFSVVGVSKSLQTILLKTDGPLRANFRRIKQGGYPLNLNYMETSAQYRCIS